jgi:hypothetical protein
MPIPIEIPIGTSAISSPARNIPISRPLYCISCGMEEGTPSCAGRDPGRLVKKRASGPACVEGGARARGVRAPRGRQNSVSTATIRITTSGSGAVASTQSRLGSHRRCM